MRGEPLFATRLSRHDIAGVVALALLAMIAARLVRAYALADMPHVQDEFAYLVQAKMYAAGRLSDGPLLPRGAFNMWFVDDRAARFSIFPPGWPLILAGALRIGLENWANPILHGVTVLVVARASRKALGTFGAIVSSGLYAFSPQALLIAASLMSHAVVALASAVILSLIAGLVVSPSQNLRAEYAWAGALGALLVITRPLCAVVVAAAFVVAIAAAARRGAIRPLGPTLVLGGFAAGALLFFAYNARLTGNAWITPQTNYFDSHLPPADLPAFAYHKGCNALGIGPGHGCDHSIAGATHTLVGALENTGDNLRAWLLLLGGGPIVPLAALFAIGQRNRTINKIALFAISATLILYALYWYPGTCYGARFYHAALPFAAILAASGLLALHARAPRLFTATVVVTVALNAVVMHAAARELQGGYWGVDARFMELKRNWRAPPALIMIAFNLGDESTPPRTKYFWTTQLVRAGFWAPNITANGAIGLNDEKLRDPVVFAKFHPSYVSLFRERFPDRALWLYIVTPDGRADRVEPWGRGASPSEPPTPPDNFDGYRLDGLERRATDLHLSPGLR